MVAPEDVEGALGTMDGTSLPLARFRERAGTCAQLLAWVTIARAPGQPARKSLLRSGNYFTPAFDLPDVALRVAIPYPAPYETGRGERTVVGASAGAMIALSPPWAVRPAAEATRPVTWRPVERCADRHA
jgi:hypothetical protein